MDGDAGNSLLSGLPVSDQLELDRICKPFERELAAGRSPAVPERLSGVRPELRLPLVLSLLELEWDYARREKKPIDAAMEAARFPEFRDEVQRAAARFLAGRTDTATFNERATDRQRRIEGEQLPKGTRVGKFEILSHLGHGSFGHVYHARDTQLHRDVALKIPRAGSLARRDDADNFLREARAAAQLSHPGIVPVYEAGEADGFYFIASQRIIGRTLREALDAGRHYSFDEIAGLIELLAEALHYAHLRGIFHRDVKPENVMLDEKGRPYLMDFGLARRLEGEELRTAEGLQLGTPAYMSPEQAQGQSHLADARSDQWALGVMMYELLAGRRPFRGESIALLLAAIQEHDATPPRKWAADIPLDLETLVLKCLEKDPAARYPSCQHMAEEIARWKRDEPILARPVSWTESTWRWMRRNPVVSGLGMAVAALFLVAAGILAVSSVLLGQANTDLNDALGKSKKSEKDAIEQTEKAKASDRESRARLARQRIDTAMRTAEGGDPHRGLIGLVDAWQLTADQVEQEDMHRRRLGMALRYSPELKQIWFDTPVALVSKNGGYVATVLPSKLVIARTSDLSTQLEIDIAPSQQIFPFVFSPREDQVAVCHADKSVHFLSPETGREVGPRLVHSAIVQRAVWDLSGRRLATAIACDVDPPVNAPAFSVFPPSATTPGKVTGWEIRVWELPSGKPISPPIRIPVAQRAEIFFGDQDSALTTVSRNTFSVWDIATGQSTFSGKGIASGDFGYWQDDTVVVDRTGKRWNVAALAPLGTQMKSAAPQENAKGVFSDDGQWYVACFNEQAKFEIWHTQRGPFANLATDASFVQGVPQFLGDGRFIGASQREENAQIWDLATKRQILELASGHTNTFLEASRNMRFLVSADGNGRTSKLWERHSAKVRQLPSTPRKPLFGDAPAPGGAPLEAGPFVFGELDMARMNALREIGYWTKTNRYRLQHGGQFPKANVQLFDMQTGRAKGQRIEVNPSDQGAFSADGRYIVTWSLYEKGRVMPGPPPGDAILWDVETGQPVKVFKEKEISEAAVARCLITGDSRFVVVSTRTKTRGARQGHLYVWDIEKKQPAFPMAAGFEAATLLSVSADHRLLAILDYPRKLTVIEVATGKPVIESRDVPFQPMDFAFAPAGNQLLMIGNSQALVLDVRSDSSRVMALHSTMLRGRFSDDARLLATWGGSTVQIWDPRLGQQVAAALTHDASITEAWFDEKNENLLVIDATGKLHEWRCGPDTRTLDQIATECRLRAARDLTASGVEEPLTGARLRETWALYQSQPRPAESLPYFPPAPLDSPAQPATPRERPAPQGRAVSPAQFAQAFKLEYFKLEQGPYRVGQSIHAFYELHLTGDSRQPLSMTGEFNRLGTVVITIQRLAETAEIPPLAKKKRRANGSYELTEHPLTWRGGIGYPGHRMPGRSIFDTTGYRAGRYRLELAWTTTANTPPTKMQLEFSLDNADKADPKPENKAGDK